MRPPYYAVLKDRKVIPVEKLSDLEDSFTKKDQRIIGRSHQMFGEVSTVFLGINHGFGEHSLWFETMIFGGPFNDYQVRYETYEQAVTGHRVVVWKLRLFGWFYALKDFLCRSK